MAEVDTIDVLDKDAVARNVATLSKLIKTAGLPGDAKVVDPDAVSATLAALLRGILQQNVDVLAKIIAAPATEAKQDAMITALAGLHTDLATTLAPYLDGLEGLIGTSNTTLASILTGVATTLAGYTDGLEALVTSSNTKLDSIHTDLATTLAGYVDGLETLATALNGYVDGLEGVLGTSAGAAVVTDANGTIQQYLRGIVKLLITAGTVVLGAGTAIIGKFGIDQTTPGTTNRVFAQPPRLIDVTLSLDTSAYASGDLLADTQQIANAFSLSDGRGMLHSLLLIDEDDQGAALDIYLLSANNSLGTENAAPSITDASARDILCRVQVGTGDYYDLGGVRVADLNGLARIIKAASGTADLYIAAVNGTGTPTYTAAGLRLRLGILE